MTASYKLKKNPKMVVITFKDGETKSANIINFTTFDHCEIVQEKKKFIVRAYTKNGFSQPMRLYTLEQAQFAKKFTEKVIAELNGKCRIV